MTLFSIWDNGGGFVVAFCEDDEPYMDEQVRFQSHS